MTRKQHFTVHGNCSSEFEAVRDVFSKNFGDGLEEEGATLAVFHRGRLVVNLWGGYAEKKFKRPWREDTLACIFSCTKSIGAICMAILVDRGLCNYDDRITKYWPDYRKNGKDETTIAMLLEHRAGLPYFHKKLELEDLINDDRMRKLIEDEKPVNVVGKYTEYHTLTYGWILDILFQSIDRNKRTVGEFLKEEITDKYGLDIHMGNSQAEEYRFARLSNPSLRLRIREFFAYPFDLLRIAKTVLRPGGNFDQGIRNMHNFGKEFTSYNNPELRIHGQPAVNAIATAKALAELHYKAFDGTLLSEKMIQTLKIASHPNKFDRTLGYVQDKGRGFIYTRSPMGSTQIGHYGVGGQQVHYDFDNELSIAYICNGMKMGVDRYVITYERLERIVYECLKKTK